MLFLNVLRTLKKKWVQLILLGVIITLSSFIYTMMDYSVKNLLEPTETYFEAANQEDFAMELADGLFTKDYQVIEASCPTVLTSHPDIYTVSALYEIDQSCYDSVLNARLDAIKTTYQDITLELREYKDVYFNYNNTSTRMRILKQNDEINQTYLISGQLPSNSSEITVTEIFAQKHDLAIGDTLTINAKSYQISGYTLFPDYSLTILSSDLIIDNKSQTIGTVIDTEFEQLSSPIGFTVAGTTSLDDDTFTKQVTNTIHDNELPYVTNVTLTINNMRSGAIYAELAGGRAMNILLSLLIASIGLIIVGIMVSKVLH
ncbi:MAG: hypothetical protein K9L26_02950, partial [Candidatus Izimaplasma sp.]|nr:hypothetical protein [Candidatus Izimaplasma bacterium]